MSPIQVDVPPAIFRNRNDVWYGIAGSVWVEVPANTYTVKLSEGVYSCTCPGYGFRRKCRHITEIKNETK